MLHSLFLIVAVAVAAPVTPLPETATEFVLHADDWARPRHGARVAALPSVQAAVAAWRQGGDAQLEIVHPGGEAGAMWGAELRDWLVALGVTPAALRIVAGSARDDAVLLRVVPAS